MVTESLDRHRIYEPDALGINIDPVPSPGAPVMLPPSLRHPKFSLALTCDSLPRGLNWPTALSTFKTPRTRHGPHERTSSQSSPSERGVHVLRMERSAIAGIQRRTWRRRPFVRTYTENFNSHLDSREPWGATRDLRGGVGASDGSDGQGAAMRNPRIRKRDKYALTLRGRAAACAGWEAIDSSHDHAQN